MSDQFLEFSEVVRALTGEEEEWLRHQLEEVVVVDGKEYPASEVPDEGKVEWSGYRGWLDDESYSPEAGLGFAYEFGDDSSENGWGRHLWVHAEDYGEPEQVAHLVQKFLRRFRPDDYWTLCYGVHCSQPCVGTFGGGALMVTAEKTHHQGTGDFLDAAIKEVKRRKPSARPAGSGGA